MLKMTKTLSCEDYLVTSEPPFFNLLFFVYELHNVLFFLYGPFDVFPFITENDIRYLIIIHYDTFRFTFAA